MGRLALYRITLRLLGLCRDMSLCVRGVYTHDRSVTLVDLDGYLLRGHCMLAKGVCVCVCVAMPPAVCGGRLAARGDREKLVSWHTKSLCSGEM